MTPFGPYARYYDLLNRDKDYAREAEHVARLLHDASPGVSSILELGCGTGSHAIELGRLGFEVTGVETSEAMLARALARGQALEEPLRARLRFVQGDARTCRLKAPFDAVLALFHVLSYQCADADVAATFATAATHLRSGSPFVFDFWYGPAVLAQQPEERERRAADDALEVTRTARPLHREGEHCVAVRYAFVVRDRRSGACVEQFEETHTVRYFFLPWLERQLAHAALRLVSAAEMGTGAPLSTATWSACAVARKL